jgi:hypothetical protein
MPPWSAFPLGQKIKLRVTALNPAGESTPSAELEATLGAAQAE